MFSAMFIVIQGGEHILNVNQISDIHVEAYEDGTEEWTISMSSGNDFTIDSEDIPQLKKALEIEGAV